MRALDIETRLEELALHLPTDQVDEQTLSLVQGQGEWIKLNALLKGLLEGTA